MRQGVLVTAGERLGVDCAVSWVGDLIEEAADGGLTTEGAEEATVRIRVEATRDPFETSGWRPLARGVLGHDRSLVLRNLLSIGFDLRVDVEDGTPRFMFRWRPSGRERAMAVALRSRFHLLARSALLRYPALWWAGTRGRAPLHASACTVGDLGVALLAGPGGVGKSTLVSKELAAGGSAICDNVCVADGASAWGVVEPLRVEGGGGRRMPHGRRETAMPGRVAVLAPDRLVVLERGSDATASVRPCDQEVAARSRAGSPDACRRPSSPSRADPGPGCGSCSPPWTRRPGRGREGLDNRPPAAFGARLRVAGRPSQSRRARAARFQARRRRSRHLPGRAPRLPPQVVHGDALQHRRGHPRHDPPDPDELFGELRHGADRLRRGRARPGRDHPLLRGGARALSTPHDAPP